MNISLAPLYTTLINAGVGAFMAFIILAGLYRLTSRLGGRFIEAQRAQAAALGQQAQAMNSLTVSVQEALQRDSGDHREMLVLLRYIAQKQKDYDEVAREHEARKKQTHPHCPAGTLKD